MNRTVEIGVAAHARGFLDARQLAQAVAELGGTPDEQWVHRGHLTRAQLDAVVAQLGGAVRRATRPGYRAHTPISAVHDLAHTDVDRSSPLPPRETRAPARRTGALERYARTALLGAGGMGEVHDVTDTLLGRRIAAKTLRPQLVGSDVAVRLLEREARVTGSLQHPNIIPVYDAGYRDDLGPFYTMRLVEQPSLEAVIDGLRASDPAFVAEYTLSRLLRHFVQVCRAIDYAHSRGVVHCDLKPANILIGSFGEVLVVDWGLAYVMAEGHAHRGGTPGYLAPEQLPPGGTIDARTDVFALGAVLYELLTLEPAFPFEVAAPLPPLRPSVMSPDRAIAAEVEDICMCAIAVAPIERFPSAGALATALDAFLEGTRERERRRAHAAELVEHGDRLAEDYRESLETRPDRIAGLDEARALVMPWDPPWSKRELWDAEDRVAVLDALGIRTLQAAIAAYEQALDEQPGNPDARRGLASLYHDQMERAHERRDELDRIFFEELVKQYDDGTLADATQRGGVVTIRAVAGTRVRIAALDERDRRLVAVREREVEPGDLRLPPGSYLATLERDGVVVRAPLYLRAGEHPTLAIDMAAAADREPGELYIPGGPALVAGKAIERGRALREVNVPAFYLGERPVSFAEYLEFLGDVRRSDIADDFLPRASDGAPLWEWRGARFEAARVGEWHVARADLLRLPVFGVDARSALRYAAWRSATTGRSFRLPTELEWEKAARGVDGRTYPWGDRFDAAFCKMRESRPGLAAPEPSGAFADDVSPYGARDLAGGVADWVTPLGGEPQQMVARGGAWCDWSGDCRVDARRVYHPLERSPRVGFRLARDG